MLRNVIQMFNSFKFLVSSIGITDFVVYLCHYLMKPPSTYIRTCRDVTNCLYLTGEMVYI